MVPPAKILTGCAIILCGFFVGLSGFFSGWLGAVVWTPWLVGMIRTFWVEAKEITRKRRFDAHLNFEQMCTILELRRIVEDVEAHTKLESNWKRYFAMRYWSRAELPTKPSLEEIESALKESEDSVGTFDINMQWAISALLIASRKQKDTHLERRMLELYIPQVDHAKGKNHETLITVLARAGQLHFADSKFETGAQELSRALDLQSLHKQQNPQSPFLMRHNLFMIVKEMLAMAYFTNNDLNKAETLLSELLPVLEQEQGTMSTQTLGTQLIRGLLIALYTKKGHKALKDDPQGNKISATTTFLRYLRDALALTAVHPSFYTHNLKTVARLFIWSGRIEEGNTAFRLANTVHEAGLRTDMPQRSCLCSPTEQEVEKHGFRKCDACKRNIHIGERWFFCLSCDDGDLCEGCYEGGVKGDGCSKEGAGEDGGKCKGQFYEVRGDETEEGISVHVWIAGMVERLIGELRKAT